MIRGDRLGFRRHLALLGLLWLLHELAERPGAHMRPAWALPVSDEHNYTWLPHIHLNYSLVPAALAKHGPARFPSQALDEQVAHYYQRPVDTLATSPDQLRLLAIKAALRTAPMLVHSSWGYATQRDNQVSGGPAANQDACLAQLGHIEARLVGQPPPQLQDVPLVALLDTYGRVPSELLRGNTKWLGSYTSCLDTQLDRHVRHQQPSASNLSLAATTQAAGRIKFRYCLAALRSRAWARSAPPPQSTGQPTGTSKWINFGVSTHHFNLELFFYRLGVCVPEECDSLAFSQQPQVRASISRLAQHGLAEPFAGPDYQLTDLYCLPDERSPLRQLSLGGKLFLGFVLLWLALILFVSSSSSPASTGPSRYLWQPPPPPPALTDDCALGNNWRLYTRHLARRRPPRAQTRSATTSGREETGKRKQPRNSLQVSAANGSAGGSPQIAANEKQPPDTKVDTSCLNALKVVCLSWLMAAHCVIYLGSAVGNPGLLKLYARSFLSYALSMGAIYITEAFFIITGCLTAYIIFKQHSAKEAKPIPWLLLVLNRYLRIVPLYLLVYAYVRLVSLKWGGSGPQWDYAVSDNSQRRQCLLESWLPTLTLTTNYLNLYEHCILGGWYLSVDMQFTLLSVPFLLLLQRAELASNSTIKKALMLAYSALILAILSSASASVISLILQAEVDLSYLLKLVPHSVAMLTSSLNQYTNPILRFRAYAMGLLTGHLLHLYESGRLPVPTAWLRAHKTSLTVASLVGCFGTMFAPLLYPNQLVVVSHDVSALLIVASATLIDLCLCALIFLLCTGIAPSFMVRPLNAPVWSLLSSLSLAALLIHTELIIILTSQLDPPPSVGYSVVLFVFSATLLLTYPIALAVHLCFELPVNRLITRCMQRLRPHQEPDNKQ